MPTIQVEERRIQKINDKDVNEKGKYVLYWMEQSKRTEYNHALAYAVHQANELKQPLLVCYGITNVYPDFNLRHFTFLMEGLQETEKELKDMDIKLIARLGDPADVALDLANEASMIICDRGYLKHQRKWREKVAGKADCQVIQVESDVIVPVEVASDKAEYAARTIRPKLQEHYKDFLNRPTQSKPKKSSVNLNITGEKLDNIDKLARAAKVDDSVEPVSHIFKGGTSEAKMRFRKFIKDLLDDYDDHRNQPQTNNVSHMSKYLHFGQISPVYLVQEITDKAGGKNVDSFVEELLVRRELAVNYVYFTPDYETYQALPEWAHKTLDKHKKDEREHTYTRKQLENAETHDPYWNASMKEMKHTGYMHNYMRMYWGKKILEWSNTPQYAYKTAIRLNNCYLLDGRDCNSYANVSWVFGQHDRGWTERPVYGKVRSMMKSGLERKADPEAYVQKVEEMING
ncbi:MAG: deoxyribodipyrimidine photo-lyase [Cyclobacteriaceae bacterium]